MFDDAGNDEDLNEFKINRTYEKRFNKKMQGRAVDLAKARYGADYEKHLGIEESDSGSELAEDEDGALFNEKVAVKFLETLAKLKSKDPSIYESKGVFAEEDFGKGEEQLLGRRGGGRLTYKDQVRKQALKGGLEEGDGSGGSDMEEEEENKLTNHEMREKSKREFQRAAGFEDDEEGEDQEENGGFLVKKKKTEQERLTEDKEFKKFLKRSGEFKGRKAARRTVQKVWGEAGQMALDKEDRFLRDFVLNRGWVDSEDELSYADSDGGAAGAGNPFAQVDMEDEAHEDEADRFEKKINFRFEEEDGAQIRTYERDVADTLREKKSKRAEKRRERKERKKQEKEEFRREVEVLKGIKKTQIEGKVRKLLEVAGLDESAAPKLQQLMRGEFEEGAFESGMGELFNDNYFDEEEADADLLKQYVEDVERNFDKAMQGERFGEVTLEAPNAETAPLDADKANVLTPRPSVPIELRKKLGKEEAKVLNSSLASGIWFYCDSCYRGIQPLEPRFDALDKEDFSVCKGCAGAGGLPYKLKKVIVPEGCVPPSDAQIREILGRFLVCNKCEAKMDDTVLYYRHKEEADYFLCEMCFNFQKKRSKKQSRNFEKVKPKRINAARALEEGNYEKLKGKDSEVDQLIGDFEQIDFEDVIAGGLKTRFSYTSVAEDAFDLDDDDLLYCDDKLLNKYLSIRKLAPYREKQEMSSKAQRRMRKMLGLIRSNVEANKEKFRKEIALNEEEEELREKAKKNPKLRKKYEAFVAAKEERVRQIYAKDAGRQGETMLTDMTKAEIDDAVQNDGQLVSDARLKSYNLM